MQPDLAKGTSTYALSAYLSPPGRDCVLHSQRHDYAVALWRRQGRQAELVSYWAVSYTHLDVYKRQKARCSGL